MIQERSSKDKQTENGESASYGKIFYAELNLVDQMAKTRKRNEPFFTN